jgi:hypothetical protein
MVPPLNRYSNHSAFKVAGHLQFVSVKTGLASLAFQPEYCMSSMTTSPVRSRLLSDYASILQLFRCEYNWEIANIPYALCRTYVRHATLAPDSPREASRYGMGGRVFLDFSGNDREHMPVLGTARSGAIFILLMKGFDLKLIKQSTG